MTSTENKKKKKQVQVLVEPQPEVELAGSAKYLTEHKFDRILKRYREEMKAEIAEHNQTKKQIIIRTAQQLEKEGYPVNQICDRISKSSKGLGVSQSYVRKCLDDKYKDQEQMKVALIQNQQSHAGATDYRQQEQLRKKDVKDITLEDIKVASPSKTKQVAKYWKQRGDWFEQQAKQQSQEQPSQQGQPIQQQVQEDKDKIIAALREENKRLVDWIAGLDQIFKKILDREVSDQEIGSMLRQNMGMVKTFRKNMGKWLDALKGDE